MQLGAYSRQNFGLGLVRWCDNAKILILLASVLYKKMRRFFMFFSIIWYMKEKIKDRYEYCLKLAKKHGWFKIRYHADCYLLSFSRYARHTGYTRLDIALSTMTVTTSLTHPRKGKTQYNRRRISGAELDMIFFDPRVHGLDAYRERKFSKRKRGS